MFFGKHSKQTRNYSRLWREFKTDKKASKLLLEISLWFLLPGFSVPCDLPCKGAESAEHWQGWFPSSQAGTSSVSTTCSGSRLSSQLRVGMKSMQERSGPPLARLTGRRGLSLAYECVCRQGDTEVCSRILAHDLFYFLSCLHSLMQNTFNAAFLWRIGVWENEVFGFFFHGTTKAYIRNLHKLKLAFTPLLPQGSAQWYIYTLERRDDTPIFSTQMQFW